MEVDIAVNNANAPLDPRSDRLQWLLQSVGQLFSVQAGRLVCGALELASFGPSSEYGFKTEVFDLRGVQVFLESSAPIPDVCAGLLRMPFLSLSETLEAFPSPVFRLTAEGQVVFWNAKVELLEMDPEPLGIPIETLLGIDRPMVQAAMETGEPVYFRSPSGRRLEIQIRIAPAVDWGMWCWVSPVSSGESFYRSVLDNLPMELVVFDSDHRYLYCNSKAIRSSEVREWIIGRTNEDYGAARNVDPGIIQKRREMIDQTLESRTQSTWEEGFSRPDGDKHYLRIINPVFSEERLLYVVGYGLETTDLKRMERELRLIRRAVESSSDMVIIYDEHLNVAYQNPAALEHLGTTEVGHRDISPLRLDKMQWWSSIIEETQKSQSWSGEVALLRRDDQEFQAHVRLNLVLDDDNVTPLGMIVVITDISLRTTVERLKDELITTLSHELRTPLTSLRGAIGLLAGIAETELGQVAQNLIRIALKNTERLARHISDIIDMDKWASGEIFLHRQHIALSDLVVRAIEDVREDAEARGLTFATSLGESVRIWGDADRLLQSLVRLLENAVRFSPITGSVQVRVFEKSNAICIEVEDEGPGVPESFSEHIFRPFSRLDTATTRERGGLGLSLAMVRVVAEQHGGTVGYTNLHGRPGCVFHVELPTHS